LGLEPEQVLELLAWELLLGLLSSSKVASMAHLESTNANQSFQRQQAGVGVLLLLALVLVLPQLLVFVQVLPLALGTLVLIQAREMANDRRWARTR
jgi:hypothetical protein